MNRKTILFSSIGLTVLMYMGEVGVGAGKSNASKNETPAFVVPSPLPTENSPDNLTPSLPPDQQSNSPALSNYDTESVEHPLGRGTPGFAFLMGGAFQHTGTGWDTAPTLALRYYFPKSSAETSGPESLSPWSVELGAVLPHRMTASGGGDINETINNIPFQVKIRNFSSEHLALQYHWAMRRPFRMTPEISMGLSIAQFQNEFTADYGNGNSPHSSSNTNSLGPLVRLGLPLLANDWFSFRLEMGYVNYANKVNAFGQTFDMGISGLGIYPSIQISLGYLHPGVEKGVYLPPSALPLWAIAALQTEKRSPIIAPPEVALNAHQAAQGGLAGNILFQYKNRSAQKVELLSDFNHWKPEPMYMDSAHVWVTVKDLKAGAYHYVYLVNGKREIRDPWNTSFDPSRRAHGVSSFVVPEVMPSRE